MSPPLKGDVLRKKYIHLLLSGVKQFAQTRTPRLRGRPVNERKYINLSAKLSSDPVDSEVRRNITTDSSHQRNEFMNSPGLFSFLREWNASHCIRRSLARISAVALLAVLLPLSSRATPALTFLHTQGQDIVNEH